MNHDHIVNKEFVVDNSKGKVLNKLQFTSQCFSV